MSDELSKRLRKAVMRTASTASFDLADAIEGPRDLEIVIRDIVREELRRDVTAKMPGDDVLALSTNIQGGVEAARFEQMFKAMQDVLMHLGTLATSSQASQICLEAIVAKMDAGWEAKPHSLAACGYDVKGK